MLIQQLVFNVGQILLIALFVEISQYGILLLKLIHPFVVLDPHRHETTVERMRGRGKSQFSHWLARFVMDEL